MKWILMVALGGAAGASLRAVIASRGAHWLPWDGHWVIMAINGLGCFFAGALFFTGAAALQPDARAFLLTGVLGGLTTYSTFALDAGRLFASGRWVEAGAYVIGTQVVVLSAFFLGAWVHEWIFS